MKKYVLFKHGAGQGAYEEDGLLVASLQNALGSAYDVRYPKMVNEESPEYADWKAQSALCSKTPPSNHPRGQWAWASIWARFG